MSKIPQELREIIARNIRNCRMKKFPGRGGGKLCAETFGVSPQQWSPWERGSRTPDEMRLQQLADFFGVTVELLRRDHSKPVETTLPEMVAEIPEEGLHWLNQLLRAAMSDGVVLRLEPAKKRIPHLPDSSGDQT